MTKLAPPQLKDGAKRATFSPAGAADYQHIAPCHRRGLLQSIKAHLPVAFGRIFRVHGLSNESGVEHYRVKHLLPRERGGIRAIYRRDEGDSETMVVEKIRYRDENPYGDNG